MLVVHLNLGVACAAVDDVFVVHLNLGVTCAAVDDVSLQRAGAGGCPLALISIQ